jgi:hypothetical protein
LVSTNILKTGSLFCRFYYFIMFGRDDFGFTAKSFMADVKTSFDSQGPWDDPSIHPVSETFTIVDNPYPSGLNPSSKVMKFIRRGILNGGQPWGGFWADIYPNLDITQLKYIHVKVWKPRTSVLSFKIEGGTTGTLEKQSTNQQTLVNDWEDFVFDFTSMDGTYPIVAFMPDREEPLTLNNDIVIYFDEIALSDRPYQIYTGISSPKEISFTVYPNPCSEQVTVSNTEDIQKVDIYDSMGRNVKSLLNVF